MNKYIFIIVLLFASFFGIITLVSAQLEDPVTWTYSLEKAKGGGYELVFQAEIEAGWHLYSQFIKEGGPVPTSFNFEAPEGFNPEKSILEKGELYTENDDIFGMELAYFNDEVTFVQKIKNPGRKVGIKGFVEYMVCNDEKCLPPVQKEFVFVIP